MMIRFLIQASLSLTLSYIDFSNALICKNNVNITMFDINTILGEKHKRRHTFIYIWRKSLKGPEEKMTSSMLYSL
jgi:hypothetical protein